MLAALALALVIFITRVPVSGARLPDNGQVRHFEIKNGRIIDRYGRVFVFRGINIANNSKVSRDHLPFTSEEDSYWDMLKEWGFNLVRFCVFWEAIEPEKGVFDHVYIDRVGRLLERAADRGIYAIVDMHQDIFSRWLGGDGAPAWVLREIGIDPERNDGFGGQFWSFAYTLSQDVRRAFTFFWSSRELKFHYIASLVELARRVRSNPYVIGFDLMNEPSPGNLDNSGGNFENGVLKDFYSEAISAIRRVHPDAIGFIEPADMYFSWLDNIGLDRVVFASHMYEPISTTFRVLIFPPGLFTCLFYLLQKGKADQLGVPLLVGEFGAPWGLVPEGGRNQVISAYYRVFERTFTSCALWDFSVRDVKAWNEEDFSILDELGRPRGMEVVCRPYAVAVNGEPLFQEFDPTTRTYRLLFRGKPSIVPTEIYTAKGHQYPDGPRVWVSDGRCRFSPDGRILTYWPARAGVHMIAFEPQRR